MNRIFIAMIALMLSVAAGAQEKADSNRPQFSPEKFHSELEQFIVREACLTPEESTQFFPLYEEMRSKQRGVFDRMRRLNRVKPADEERCREVIIELDNLEIEAKQIEQTYHNKIMTIMPASKLFDAIKAENRFHRRMLRKYNREQRETGNKE